jgi:hypothetical protein
MVPNTQTATAGHAFGTGSRTLLVLLCRELVGILCLSLLLVVGGVACVIPNI